MACCRKVLCCLALLFAACEMPPGSRPLPDSGPAPSAVLTVLWTGAIRGEVYPNERAARPPGGLDRLASVLSRERRADPGLVLVDLGDLAGDALEGGAVDGALVRRERARVVVEAMGRMGYDAIVPGERDLALGASRLRGWATEAGVPLLGTNLAFADTNEPLGPTELWVETAGGEVALLGIVAPLDRDLSLAAAAGHGRPVEVLEPEAALGAALRSVRPRAAYVVLLAHGPTDWAARLVEAVAGVDLCLVAHDGEGPFAAPLLVGSTYLLGTGRGGGHVGRLHVNLAADAVYRLAGAAVEVSADLDGDDEVAALVATLPARLNEAQARLDGASDRAEHPSGGGFVGWTFCATCHLPQAEAWQASAHLGAFRGLQRVGFQSEPECFACHATGFGHRGGFETSARTPLMRGVGCEACHGPGQGAHDEPGYGRTDETTCRSCHDPALDPSFAYDEAYEAVRHDVSRPGR